jgi:hypothetical protein
MKTLLEKKNKSYTALVKDMYDLAENDSEFILDNESGGRFFTPLQMLYDKRFHVCSLRTKQADLIFYKALLDSIDKGYHIVGYKDGCGHYIVSLGTTSDTLIKAVKHAKIKGVSEVLDLANSKILRTNG